MGYNCTSHNLSFFSNNLRLHCMVGMHFRVNKGKLFLWVAWGAAGPYFNAELGLLSVWTVSSGYFGFPLTVQKHAER